MARRWLPCLVLSLLVPLSSIASAEDPPKTPEQRPVTATDLVERAEVKLVQVDVSVIDPKKGTAASVPDVPLEAFDIRLDGKKLTDEQAGQLKLDRICGAATATVVGPEGPQQVRRPIVVVVDFNYVDARGRERVADAIDAIAAGAADRPEVYKIYGLTRQVRSLTPAFTKDAAEIRAAAEIVRKTAWRGDPTTTGAFRGMNAAPSMACGSSG
ncbi:MAG: hypothetical protein KBD01_11080 [Acidobacteria bacterium]|nr:hypothetical protein [Acidobacteriota bacterium]